MKMTKTATAIVPASTEANKTGKANTQPVEGTTQKEPAAEKPEPKVPEATIADPAKLLESEREKFEKLRAYIKEKEQKLSRLEALERNIAGLEDLQKQNEECDDVENIFEEEDKNFLLTLSGTKPGYNRPDFFKINNPELISEVIDLLIGKLSLQTEKLRAEIAAH